MGKRNGRSAPRKSALYRGDGWRNLITGLGSARTAKKEFTRHVSAGAMDDRELESLFFDDGLAARIVRLLPDDMFREGWDYTFPKLDEIQAAKLSERYEAAMEELEVRQKLREAFNWKRLYGGSAVLIGAVDGRTPDLPLEPHRIKALERLRVIDRTDIEFQGIRWQDDPTRPRYGLPALYPVRFDVPGGEATETMMVHWTRVIELHGDTLPRRSMTGVTAEQRYWGISALQRANDRLRSLGSSLGSIDQLLSELGVGKFKVKDLATLLSSEEGEAAIRRRVELMDLTRSTFRSQYIDAEEDFTRDTASFQGVPEVLHVLFMLVAADTGYPMTRLFGMSPAGMNATGESDMNNYYDMVRSTQVSELQPALLRLARVIAQWQGLEEPYIEFRPLETMNEKERAELDRQKAETERMEAETYAAYINAGVLEPHEARFLKYGATLDGIPAPVFMPPVEPAAEDGGSDKTESDSTSSEGGNGNAGDAEGG